MSQPISTRLQQVIEIIESLSSDEQQQLMVLLRQWSLAYQRAELVARVAEARRAYKQQVGQTYRAETTVSSDGILTIAGLPFHAGDQVQVIVSGRRAPTSGERYPLRGKPIRYTEPFESIAEDDWEALQ